MPPLPAQRSHLHTRRGTPLPHDKGDALFYQSVMLDGHAPDTVTRIAVTAEAARADSKPVDTHVLMIDGCARAVVAPPPELSAYSDGAGVKGVDPVLATMAVGRRNSIVIPFDAHVGDAAVPLAKRGNRRPRRNAKDEAASAAAEAKLSEQERNAEHVRERRARGALLAFETRLIERALQGKTTSKRKKSNKNSGDNAEAAPETAPTTSNALSVAKDHDAGGRPRTRLEQHLYFKRADVQAICRKRCTVWVQDDNDADEAENAVGVFAVLRELMAVGDGKLTTIALYNRGDDNLVRRMCLTHKAGERVSVKVLPDSASPFEETTIADDGDTVTTTVEPDVLVLLTRTPEGDMRVDGICMTPKTRAVLLDSTTSLFELVKQYGPKDGDSHNTSDDTAVEDKPYYALPVGDFPGLDKEWVAEAARQSGAAPRIVIPTHQEDGKPVAMVNHLRSGSVINVASAEVAIRAETDAARAARAARKSAVNGTTKKAAPDAATTLSPCTHIVIASTAPLREVVVTAAIHA